MGRLDKNQEYSTMQLIKILATKHTNGFWGLFTGLLAGLAGGIASILIYILLVGPFIQKTMTLLIFMLSASLWGLLTIYNKYPLKRVFQYSLALCLIFPLAFSPRQTIMVLLDQPVATIERLLFFYLMLCIPIIAAHFSIYRITLPYLVAHGLRNHDQMNRVNTS